MMDVLQAKDNKIGVIPAQAGIHEDIKKFYVYIMASKKKGTLYVGVTSSLVRRVYEHKENLIKGFTSKYNIHHLVYYEVVPSAEEAITRESNMKAWKRAWKIKLIEENNPEWKDLYVEVV